MEKETKVKTAEEKTEASAEEKETAAASESAESQKEEKTEDTKEDKKAVLKKDKEYKKGKLIYDIGTLFMYLYLLLFSAKQLLHMEIIAGNTFISNYLNFTFIIPLILMIIGLVISDKAAKRMDVKEHNKLWTGILAAAGVFIIALSICEILMPSYKVYDLSVMTSENSPGSVREGQELIIAEYRTGKILAPAPVTKPGYVFVDVYGKYGIFAFRKQTVTNNNGSYSIEKKGDQGSDYLITVRSLGREETFPFSY